MTKIDLFAQATRPIVTILFAVTLCYGFVAKLVGAEAFLSIVGVVTTFWFSSRQPTPPKNGEASPAPTPQA